MAMDDFGPGFEDSDDDLSGYFDDDGNKLNPELIQKPVQCLLCANDDNPNEKVKCTMVQLDAAMDDEDFKCSAFRPKKKSPE